MEPLVWRLLRWVIALGLCALVPAARPAPGHPRATSADERTASRTVLRANPNSRAIVLMPIFSAKCSRRI